MDKEDLSTIVKTDQGDADALARVYLFILSWEPKNTDDQNEGDADDNTDNE